ncbi:hypothetical protein F4803DRAFT_522214 [Xylaria telfairii]|nr:hypothetical protein F4803DRAFT_522214 [Xylaria telfairii]
MYIISLSILNGLSPPVGPNHASLDMSFISIIAVWTRKQATRRPIHLLQVISLTTEFMLACITLGLFLSAYPKDFRETLWQIGGEAGWNSNPRLRIYFYANYKVPPEIPLIWTQRLNETNLGISILSLAISLTRIFFAYFYIMTWACNAFYDVLLSVFWVYSVIIQSSGDYSDPKHLSVRPWYLERGCSQIAPEYASFCHVSKAAFAFSVISAVFHCSCVVLSVLRVVYRCGKSEVFDGGAERAYRRFWHDDEDEGSKFEKTSFIGGLQGDEDMLI